MSELETLNQEKLSSASKNYRAYVKHMLNSVGVLKWIWVELVGVGGRAHLKKMFAWVVFTMLFALLPALLLGIVVDALVAEDMTLVWWMIVGIGVSQASAQLSNMMQSRHREWALGHIMGSVDSKMTELFFEKSVGQHVQEGSRLSASNVEKARGRVWSVVDMMLFQGTSAALRLVMSFTLICIISPIAGLIMSVLLVHYALWMLFLNRKVMEVCTPLDADFRAHNRYRGDRWEHVDRVKHSGKEAEESAHMGKWFEEIITKDRKFWLWYITVSNLRALVRTATVVTVLCFAAWQISIDAMQLSVLIPLFSWSFGIADNLWQIGMVERVVSWNMPSIQSMMDVLTMPPAIVIAEDAKSLEGNGPVAVELRGVSHTYESNKKGVRPVLKDVSLKIRAGERVALVGHSGAGKSTITRLLLRDMDPEEGAVLFNGVDLRELDLHDVLTHVGLIAQKPPVFDGTLRDNILYALSPEQRKLLDDDDIWSVLTRVQLANKERFTDGLDTKVGKSGVKLSGGEQQRLMVAAAIIQKLKFIIIDEATSSLDALTEKRVQSGLQEVLKEGVTALVIAHRFSTIRFCDRVVVLKQATDIHNGDSQIEAIGTFEELMETSPTFRELAELQSISVAPEA